MMAAVIALYGLGITLAKAQGQDVCTSSLDDAPTQGAALLQRATLPAVAVLDVSSEKQCQPLLPQGLQEAHRQHSLVQVHIASVVNSETDVTIMPLDANGFKEVTSLCCPYKMEAFFNRLLDSKGFFVCSKPHVQGLMHWFACVPDMDFQYVLDVIANGNPCKYWSAKSSTCPILSPECAGHNCQEPITEAPWTTEGPTTTEAPWTTEEPTTWTTTEAPTTTELPTTTEIPTTTEAPTITTTMRFPRGTPLLFMPRDGCGTYTPGAWSPPPSTTQTQYIYSTRAQAAEACKSRGCVGLATKAMIEGNNDCKAGYLQDGRGLWVKKAHHACGGLVGYNEWPDKTIGAWCNDCPSCP